MNDRRIRSLAIVGGGTAGWMTAAALSKALAGMSVQLRLIESPRVEPIGVGEATVPPIMDFIRQLGIDEGDLVREIKATYKLGIGFRDWTRAGHFYFHPFGPAGPGIGNIPFQAYWLKMLLAGKAERLEEYSIQAMAALSGRFARPVHAPNTPLNKFNVTGRYHFPIDPSMGSDLSAAEARASVSGLEMSLEQFIGKVSRGLLDELGLEKPGDVVDQLGSRWQGGRVMLHPADSSLQAKEIPLDVFFHKVVMLRNNLRVLEQKINGHEKLSDAEKVEFQQYITRSYGSLTTFNVLFKNKTDQFRGAEQA